MLPEEADRTRALSDSLSNADRVFDAGVDPASHSSTERSDLLVAEADSTGAGWVPDHPVEDVDALAHDADILTHGNADRFVHQDADATRVESPKTPEELFDYPVEVNRRVLHWIDEFKGRSHRSFEASLRRSGRYLPNVRAVFEEEGVPPDLAFLAHVESGFRHDARSRAGAVGMWQFMSGTARDLGLQCNKQVDERLDPEKSTRAAARYLRQLHDRYGDWYLALAAYNAGPGNVDRVIKSAGTTDFWEISKRGLLKNETRDFVPAILAATVLFKSPGAYGLAEDTEYPVAYDPVEVDSPTDLAVLASCAGCETHDLVLLNPALKAGRTPDVDRYTVRVPEGRGDLARTRLETVPPSDRVPVRAHKVRRGETLSGIASRYGITVRSLQQANDLGKSTRINVGQSLKLPPKASPIETADPRDVEAVSVSTGSNPSAQNPSAQNPSAENPSAENPAHDSDVETERAQGTAQVVTTPTHHRVRRGDTLFSLARRYGTTVAELQRRNGIRNPRDLRAGQRLIVGETKTTVPSTGRDKSAAVVPESEPEPIVELTSLESSSKSASKPVSESSGESSGESSADSGSDSTTPVLAALEDTAPPLPPPTPEELGRVASTAHVVAQARAEIAQLPEEKPAPTSKKGKTPAAVSHKVRSGETLWSIAKKHGLRVTDLRRWNGLRGTTIRPGQKLRLVP